MLRYLMLCSALALATTACKDEDKNRPVQQDSGSPDKKDAGAGPAKDKDAATPAPGAASTLRPSLPRPPTSLPAELRPPR